MKKKRALVWVFLVAVGAVGLFSCRKETSVENAVTLSGDFRAQINGVQWIAASTTKGATLLAGLINITGISSDNKQLSITLTDTVVGLYTLNQTSTSYAAYADNDSSDIYAFSSNQGSDTTQAGGQVIITEVDRVNKTLTGTFSFKVFRDIDGHQKTISNGVFYKLPYVSSLPPSSTTDTMNCKIDGTPWVGQSISAQSVSGQLAITGSHLDGTQMVGLIMPSNITAGPSYILSVTSTNYIGLYSPTPTVALGASSGTLTILSNNTTTQRIRGNFQFRASNPLGGTTPPHDLLSGFFSVYYGN